MATVAGLGGTPRDPGQVAVVVHASDERKEAPSQNPKPVDPSTPSSSWSWTDCIQWRTLPIIAALVLVVTMAVQALFSAAFITAAGLALCAAVMLYTLSYVIEYVLADTLRDSLREANTLNADLRAEITDVRQAALGLRASLEQSGIQVEVMTAENRRHEQNVAAGEVQVDRLKSTVDMLAELKATFVQAMQEGGINEAIKSVASLRSQADELRAQLATIGRDLAASEARLQVTTEANERVSAQLAEERVRLSEVIANVALQTAKMDIARERYTTAVETSAGLIFTTVNTSQAAHQRRTSTPPHTLTRPLPGGVKA